MTSPQTFTTPNGRDMTLFCREDTNDAALAHGILDEDEYGLRGLTFPTGDGKPVTALDIGAHIGIVGIALAVDNPELRVICVEPVPDNAALIRQSARANAGLFLRLFVEEAGAAGPGAASVDVAYEYTTGSADASYVSQNRFIGNIWGPDAKGETVTVPAVTIAGLAAKYGVDSFAFCKIDAEGAEWDFLASDAGLIEEVRGEFHGSPFSRMEKLLRKTHEVECIIDHGGTGIFRAVRR